VYSSIRFQTYSLPCFNELYSLFYVDGQKVVPGNIAELMTPLSLAYWLCDDGSFSKRDQSIYLCTDSFALAEVQLLVSLLTGKFNLQCTINKHGNGFRIRIRAKSIPVLQALLKDIMPSMMLHKIGL